MLAKDSQELCTFVSKRKKISYMISSSGVKHVNTVHILDSDGPKQK